MFVGFNICNTGHNPPKKSQNVALKTLLSIFMGLQNANENMFYGFGKSAFSLWKVLETLLKDL